MATAKPRKAKKAAKKKAAANRSALIQFTATQRFVTREGTDGGTWIRWMEPTWIKHVNQRKGDDRTKRAALKALRSFRNR